MKEQVIQLPDNLEVKEIKDGKIILGEKETKLTYEDVANKLFDSKYTYYIQRLGIGEDTFSEGSFYEGNAFTSKKQADKLLAINKLMNVSKYLNNGWQPDWSNDEQMKYFIVGKGEKSDITIRMTSKYQSAIVYFKNEELIIKAIEILGEKTIRLALCADY